MSGRWSWPARSGRNSTPSSIRGLSHWPGISRSRRKSSAISRGARTVLILEEDDTQLTNHLRVGDALIAIEATRTERPDEVYLLSTGTSVWFAVTLRAGDTSFYDLELEQRYGETGPGKLDNITGAHRPAKPPAA